MRSSVNLKQCGKSNVYHCTQNRKATAFQSSNGSTRPPSQIPLCGIIEPSSLPAWQLELGILAKEAYFYNPGLSLPVTCSIWQQYSTFQSDETQSRGSGESIKPSSQAGLLPLDYTAATTCTTAAATLLLLHYCCYTTAATSLPAAAFGLPACLPDGTTLHFSTPDHLA